MTTAAQPRASQEYVLRLADTSLILGQQLTGWIGHSPALEEDLGLANISLDLVGQARLLLTYAAELEGRGRSEDDLAFLREYRLIVPSVLDFVDEAFHCDALQFRGTRPPERASLQLQKPVSIGKPYLVDASSSVILPLAPLVAFAGCPVCRDKELFGYESAGDRTAYVSYQRGHRLEVDDRSVQKLADTIMPGA